MRIAVSCEKSLEPRFTSAADQCGHTLFLSEALPQADAVQAFQPEAVVLMVRGQASELQDYLVSLAQLCPALPRLLVFERQMDGHCYFTESRLADDTLRAFFYRAVDREKATLLRYPDENWQERFPTLFDSVQRRESMKTILYGVTNEEFQQTRQQYRLKLNESDFYLFVWELEKTALVDYPVNKSIHYFLHALRLEDFSHILGECHGGEVVFSDVSFAYILVNAPRLNSAKDNRHAVEHVTRALAQAGGRSAAHCFISDPIECPEDICRAHQDFKRTCAYRFFCREATAISNAYIKSHQRWFSAELIHETIDAIQHNLSFDISNEALPGLIRKLYLEIIKPSMSYKLYYLASEAILNSLKGELSVKLLLESIDSPWLVLTTQLGSVEEGCQRVLDCVSKLAQRQVKKHNISNTVVRQAIRYIEEHYTEKVSLEEIARSLNVSTSYLSQCFKEETGISIKKYMIMCRMQEAKHLLLSTDDPVCMVAVSVGYDDYRQFSKMFKALTGVSPAKCRKGVMGKPREYPREAHFSLNM